MQYVSRRLASVAAGVSLPRPCAPWALVLAFLIWTCLPGTVQAQVWSGWCTDTNAQLLEGDLNADGRVDAVCHDRANGKKWIALRNPAGKLVEVWSDMTRAWCSGPGTALHLSDINGDRRADLVCKESAWVSIDYVGAGYFGGTDFSWTTNWCTHTGSAFVLADHDKDGRADLVCIDANYTYIDFADGLGRYGVTTDCVEAEIARCGNPVADHDRDGLPDVWERGNTAAGMTPLKANLVLIPVNRPNLDRALVEPQLDKLEAFFARVPIRNLDGSTGIGVYREWGNALPASDSDALPDVTDSMAVRARGLPTLWIGKGHGLLIGSGGGGQTQAVDWSVVGNDWRTMAHELGHQLGLDHYPLDTGVPSPVYTSLMNYDYSYSFNGDPEAVHYSSGKLRRVNLDERHLNELQPYPIADLAFLSRSRYRFGLSAVSAGVTSVDFNRNGIHGENGVRADINSAYSVWLDPASMLRIGPTVGNMALASYGTQLVSIHADVPGTDYTTYSGTGLSTAVSGRLNYRVWSGTAMGAMRSLTAGGVTGNVHAVEAFGKLFVTYSTASGYAVVAFTRGLIPSQLVVRGFAVETAAPGSSAVLVRTSSPEELHLLSWDPVSKKVRQRRITMPDGAVPMLGPVSDVRAPVGGSYASLRPLYSNSPIAAAWNDKWFRIELVTTAHSSVTDAAGTRRTPFRMMRHTLGRMGAGWVVGNGGWLTQDTWNWAATRVRPTILFDGFAPHGHYVVYYTAAEASEGALAYMYLVRLDLSGRVSAAPDAPFRWTKALIGNEWLKSRSAPAAAAYGDDIALGMRLDEQHREPEADNLMIIHLKASSISETALSDFDDVGFIAREGLRRVASATR